MAPWRVHALSGDFVGEMSRRGLQGVPSTTVTSATHGGRCLDCVMLGQQARYEASCSHVSRNGGWVVEQRANVMRQNHAQRRIRMSCLEGPSEPSYI